MSLPNQTLAHSTILSSANAGSGGHSVFQYRHSPFQSHSANQLTAIGVTAYKRLVPPIIQNAETVAKEEGYIGYDDVAERLCYTDSSLTWRCMAVVEDIASLNADYVAAMLLVTNSIATSFRGYAIPGAGYYTLVDWTTAAPFASSASWNNATGTYTAATAGKFHISIQCSWRETQTNTGIRIIRIIHTNFLTAVQTILCETASEPSANRNVNTVQQCTAGATLNVGDTLHFEVAQSSGITKDVEGGTGLGASGTTMQIIKLN